MNNRRKLRSFAWVVALGLSAQFVSAAKLVSVSSRIEHGGKPFEVALPINQSGIEPRTMRDGTTLILRFDRPVNALDVKVESANALVARPVIDGKVATVKVSGVKNGEEVQLAVNIDGQSQSLNFRALRGDVNGDTIVNEADATLVAKNTTKNLTDTTARFDVATSGAIDATDIRRVRAANGDRTNGKPVVNTPPTISPIPDQKSEAKRLPPGIGFQINDTETPAEQLQVWASSETPKVLSDKAIEISGTGRDRILTARPIENAPSMAKIRVTVFDGQDYASTVFGYEFGGSLELYVGQMTPQGGSQTLGSGNATLLLAADELSALLKFTYSNLTGPETAAHIHGPADPGQSAGILFDIDTATPNPDGSYTWTLVDVGGHTVAQQVSYIKSGKTYINVHTAAYPNGEIRGQFNLVTGSQTFTPPAAPPPLPNTQPTADEASRFLTQASFGATEAEINRVVAMGYEAWIEEQFSKPRSSMLDYVLARVAQGEVPNNDNMAVEGWWHNALTQEDQLRQRVAFALSQIFVISQEDGDLSGRPREVAYYYDLLSRNAFGNYRTLLEDVTLNPEMGQYLDMRGNKKASGSQIPNENYAREILQLFSIGLYSLHPDGTLKLGEDGLPIPTYGQTEVTGFSRVFTGWTWNQAAQSSSPAADYFNPMELVVNDHEFGAKQILDNVTIPARTASLANGLLDLADAHNQIFNHANTGPFICKQLIQRLVTSNPSPGYVYRVSNVFANNGNGVRGDLKAVVKAILLDYEARAGYDLAKYPNSPVYNQGYGKLREPLLRATAMARAFRPSSLSGLYRVSATDVALLQSPLRSPTVFNFYEPFYSYPGEIATEGIVAPEFQILTEISVVSAANFLENATRNTVNNTGDVRLDFSVEQSLAGNPTALVERLNLLLCYGQLSQQSKTTIINHVNTMSAANTLERVRTAVHLIVASPEFAAQR